MRLPFVRVPPYDLRMLEIGPEGLVRLLELVVTCAETEIHRLVVIVVAGEGVAKPVEAEVVHVLAGLAITRGIGFRGPAITPAVLSVELVPHCLVARMSSPGPC